MTAAPDIGAALGAIAWRLVPGGTGIASLQRLSGGATQEIWRFDVVAANGARTPLVLRRAPGGDRVTQGGVGLAVEARLIAAASRCGVPVPGVRAVLEPAFGLGQGFVMDFVEGETLGGRIVRSAAFATLRETLAYRCGEILARLHRIDPAGFPDLPIAAPAHVLRQWHDAYRATATPRPVFEVALRWLAQHCPPAASRPCLVHGDFRNGNLMIGTDGVRAVLDWELAHIGDPIEDLGWICVNSWRFGAIDKPVGGFGQRADLWAGYAAGGGGIVDPEAAQWWEVFGTLKWGVICAGAVAAFRSVDPTVERAMIARRTSETEIDLLRLLD